MRLALFTIRLAILCVSITLAPFSAQHIRPAIAAVESARDAMQTRIAVIEQRLRLSLGLADEGA